MSGFCGRRPDGATRPGSRFARGRVREGCRAMAIEPDRASRERQQGPGSSAAVTLGGRGGTSMWAVALEGEEFAPLYTDPCDVVVALRRTRAVHPDRSVRVVAVPRRSSSN